MQLKNVSNPAAFGIEWTACNTRYQLCNPRGTSCLMMGIQTGGMSWHTTTVVSPERFGLAGPPANWRMFLAIAKAFIIPAEDGE